MEKSSAQPMAKDVFLRLWSHPVSDERRNCTEDLDFYQDALHYLIALRAPHFAALCVPRALKRSIILAFVQDHHVYVQEISPVSDSVHLLIYRPPGGRSSRRPRS